MEPGWHAPQHLRIDGLRAPTQELDLRRVDTVLFLLEHGPLSQALGNILTCAAVCRAISVGRGSPPTLKVMTETQLSNSSHGFKENAFLQDIQSGSHALLLSGATIYNRQIEGLLGAYARRGATLEALTALVDDEVPLGQKEDPRIFILDQVFRPLSDYSDKGVRSLVSNARAIDSGHSNESLRKISESIDTLLVMALPWFRHRGEPPPNIPEVVSRMITEWVSGVDIPSDILPLIERHHEAREIAEGIWQSASEVSPGVFELIGIPHAETDEVVRKVLRDMYTRDPRAKVVLEKNPDRPANALRYGEALDFERRLALGEEPEEVLDEVEKLLKGRNDSGSLLTLALDRDRERDPKDTLEKILKPAQYLPDPSGFCYVILKGPQEDLLYEEFQRIGFTLVTHNVLWMCNLQTGTARPSSFVFQAKELQRFIGLIDSMGSSPDGVERA